MTQYPEAIPGESRYVDFDEETQCWGIFGEDSGHCYELYSDRQEARDRLQS